MPHASSNRTHLSDNESHADACATAIRNLVTLLTDKYGMPMHRARALDELGLIRAAATLDFLSNNLPPESAISAATLDAHET